MIFRDHAVKSFATINNRGLGSNNGSLNGVSGFRGVVVCRFMSTPLPKPALNPVRSSHGAHVMCSIHTSLYMCVYVCLISG